MSAELATVSTSESLVSLLSRMSLDPAFNRENFAVLVAAAREEREGTRRAEFAAAMHAIQSRNLRVYRSKAGKNNKYAPLEDIHEMLAPLLHENGLTVNFNCEPRVDNGVVFRSIIIQHVNGHSETRTSPFPVDDIGANREGKRVTSCQWPVGRRLHHWPHTKHLRLPQPQPQSPLSSGPVDAQQHGAYLCGYSVGS